MTQSQLDKQLVVLPAKLLHRRLVCRQFLLEERLDFLLPKSQRYHAHSPTGQPAHPLGQVEPLVVELVRHLLLPAIRLPGRQQGQLTGAGSPQHVRLHQRRSKHRRLAKRLLLFRRPFAAWFFRDEHLVERHRHGLGPGLPPASAVEHLADSPAGFPGALRVGDQAARHVRMFHCKLHAKQNRLGAEQPLLHADRLDVRVTPLLRRAVHQAQQRRPVDHAVAREKTGMAVADANFISRNQTVTNLVDAAPPGAPEHLVNLIRPDRHLQMVATIRVGGQNHAAQRKVNAGGQAHRGHDDSQLASLGQGLNHSRTRAVAQSAVVKRDSRLQHPCETIINEIFLPGAQLERIGVR